jgi:hypothetical protein
MNRFFVYEEYGAKYELMIKDIASTYRTMPQWEMYQKGLEALASSLASINSQHDKSKKALTIGDLLVKASIHSLAKAHHCSFGTAYSKGLQISTSVCRAAETNPRL